MSKKKEPYNCSLSMLGMTVMVILTHGQGRTGTVVNEWDDALQMELRETHKLGIIYKAQIAEIWTEIDGPGATAEGGITE